MIENTEAGKALPLELIGAYRRDGVTVQKTLLAYDESDPNYRGLSLWTVMADDILRYKIVKGVGHIQNEAETRRAYAYFKGFRMDSEGNISYTGVSDDTGITEELLALDSYGWFAGGKNWDSYKDVAASDWFQAGVKYVSENNLMSGVSDTGFTSNTAISRADPVLSLWHLAGEPSTCCALPYENVESDAYRSAILWAVKMGIVGENGSTSFDYDGTVTREAFALMLYKCAGSAETKGTLNAFPDKEKVSNSTQKALRAVEKGIILGKSDSFLDPVSMISHAETATILERYCKIK